MIYCVGMCIEINYSFKNIADIVLAITLHLGGNLQR